MSALHRIRAEQAWSVIAAAKLGRDVDHADVEGRIDAGGRLNGGYLLMIALSAAIAELGLLLSSPAVVIGAMLLSPLMGPIVALGFAFCTIDWAATRRAVTSLVVGLGLALLVSLLLVSFSPLKEPTAEILARSRPTLFDLLVAVFSGVAGGYAVVRQRGEAVIGVAIATALMPPLATLGFGISTRAWSIAGGAALLFFTNLVAIALAAAGVAAVAGFRPAKGGVGHGWLSHGAVVAVVIGLCVPLTLSLRTISLESRATTRVRGDIARVFGPRARITSLSVRSDGPRISVEGLVATPTAVAGANARLQRSLANALHAGVRVRLDQVVLADPTRLTPTAAPAPGGPLRTDPLADLRAAVPFPDVAVLGGENGSAIVRLAGTSALGLPAARALENGLRERAEFRSADVTVVPPLQPLPPISVDLGDRKTPPSLGDASLQLWALSRWGATAVDVRLCRTGARPSTRALEPAVRMALAPMEVRLALGHRFDCAGATAKRPFVRLAVGSAD